MRIAVLLGIVVAKVQRDIGEDHRAMRRKGLIRVIEAEVKISQEREEVEQEAEIGIIIRIGQIKIIGGTMISMTEGEDSICLLHLKESLTLEMTGLCRDKVIIIK